MLRVTFWAEMKYGKTKGTINTWVETHRTEADVRLRAKALGWNIEKIEKI